MSVAPWSFSKIKAFEQCPKQFYHEKILKEFPFVETAATRYGTEFHTAAEEYVRDGKPLEDRFTFALDMLESLKAKKGNKIPEQKMGLTENLEPCSFFSEDVWFRGIADLIILDGDLAWVIDYKIKNNIREFSLPLTEENRTYFAVNRKIKRAFGRGHDTTISIIGITPITKPFFNVFGINLLFKIHRYTFSHSNHLLCYHYHCCHPYIHLHQ